MTKVAWRKIDADNFRAHGNRFEITADRTESGYIRGWLVEDGKTQKGRLCGNRKQANAWMLSILSNELTGEKRKAIESEVKMLLHAHRDCLRNQGVDTTKISFDVRDGYYGEAFGVIRALVVLGFEKFGASNIPGNANSWMHQLEQEVLAEEGFRGNGRCEYCLKKYGKDDKSVREKKNTEHQVHPHPVA